MAALNLQALLKAMLDKGASDLHITARPRHESEIAEAIRAVDADLYVLTGDMVFLQSGVRAFFRWLDSLGPAIRPLTGHST